MERLRTIKTSEFSLLLRLVSRLCGRHDPLARKQLLLEGLCQLVVAPAGVCVVTLHDHTSPNVILVSRAHFGPAEDLLPETLAPTRRDLEPGRNGQHLLESKVDLGESTLRATISLIRPPNDRRRFSSRVRKLVDYFHEEITWVYQADMLLGSDKARALSPRTRQTLELVLAGLGEKQIASRLKLSPNTVHHYVKSIHRTFGVSSRSELFGNAYKA